MSTSVYVFVCVFTGRYCIARNEIYKTTERVSENDNDGEPLYSGVSEIDKWNSLITAARASQIRNDFFKKAQT